MLNVPLAQMSVAINVNKAFVQRENNAFNVLLIVLNAIRMVVQNVCLIILFTQDFVVYANQIVKNVIFMIVLNAILDFNIIRQANNVFHF